MRRFREAPAVNGNAAQAENDIVTPERPSHETHLENASSIFDPLLCPCCGQSTPAPRLHVIVTTLSSTRCTPTLAREVHRTWWRWCRGSVVIFIHSRNECIRLVLCVQRQADVTAQCVGRQKRRHTSGGGEWTRLCDSDMRLRGRHGAWWKY